MERAHTEVGSKCLSEESPFGEEYILELVQKVANSEDDLIKTLLAELQKKSSKHKFLINTSRVASPEQIEADLQISTNFGAVWDSKRDGFITIKVTNNKEDSTKISNDDSNDSNDNDICEDLDTQTGSIEAVDTILITIYWIYSG